MQSRFTAEQFSSTSYISIHGHLKWLITASLWMRAHTERVRVFAGKTKKKKKTLKNDAKINWSVKTLLHRLSTPGYGLLM